MSFNFMAAVTICSDFGDPKIKSVTVSPSWPGDMAKRKKKKGVHIGIELVNIVLWFL